MGAGLTLIGLNFRNTGSPGLGSATIAGGLILMAIYMLLIFKLPDDGRLNINSKPLKSTLKLDVSGCWGCF
jgi:hypothetical protein